MNPLVTRTWSGIPNRIGIVWKVFGIPVFGYSFLPWEMPPSAPWATPDEAVDEEVRQSKRVVS